MFFFLIHFPRYFIVASSLNRATHREVAASRQSGALPVPRPVFAPPTHQRGPSADVWLCVCARRLICIHNVEAHLKHDRQEARRRRVYAAVWRYICICEKDAPCEINRFGAERRAKLGTWVICELEGGLARHQPFARMWETKEHQQATRRGCAMVNASRDFMEGALWQIG